MWKWKFVSKEKPQCFQSILMGYLKKAHLHSNTLSDQRCFSLNKFCPLPLHLQAFLFLSSFLFFSASFLSLSISHLSLSCLSLSLSLISTSSLSLSLSLHFYFSVWKSVPIPLQMSFFLLSKTWISTKLFGLWLISRKAMGTCFWLTVQEQERGKKTRKGGSCRKSDSKRTHERKVYMDLSPSLAAHRLW